MTRFTVVWSQSALDELAALWMQAGDRNSLSEAVADVDVLLSREPARRGHPLHEGILAMSYGNLRFLSTIREQDLLVDVLVGTRTFSSGSPTP